jgi:general secretion pathway protein H
MSATGEGGPAGPDRAGEAGTTLVESLVTMAIAVSIGAIVFPALEHGVAGAAFSQAFTGVRADLRMAQAQALGGGQTVDIVVAADGRSYGWTPGPERALISGLSMAPAGSVALRFYPDGSSSGGAVELTNGRERGRLDVDGVTGLVRAGS